MNSLPCSPVAVISAGNPDVNAVLYFVFFYPFAMAHLGANDLIDVANDRVRMSIRYCMTWQNSVLDINFGYGYPCNDGIAFHINAVDCQPVAGLLAVCFSSSLQMS